GAEADRAGKIERQPQRRARRLCGAALFDSSHGSGFEQMKRLSVTLLAIASVMAQVKTEVPPIEASAKPAAMERIKIHGTALEGNLEGDAVDRDVIVFLPPSYTTQKNRRFPVVYALHGYSIGAEQWSKEIHVPQTI